MQNAHTLDIMMAMPKLKSLDTEKRKNKCIRFTESEEQAIQKKADKYADGDFSKWLRHAGINYEPTKKDLSNK